MVKFSAILLIVLPGLFFIDNHTEGNNRRSVVDYLASVKEITSPGLSRRKRSAADTSSLIESEPKYENLTKAKSKNRSESISNTSPVAKIDFYRTERSLNNNFENCTNSTRSFNRTAENNTANNYDSSFDGREIKAAYYIGDRNRSGNNPGELMRDVLEPNASLGTNYSSGKYGNEPIDDSQHRSLIQFTTDHSTLPISRYSFNGTRETNRSSMTRAQTLIDFIGPVISRDAEYLEDQGLSNSEHVRVKRGSEDPGKIGENIGEAVTSSFKDDEDSNFRNELADVYPDLDEPLEPTSGQLVRKKRLNYEMLFPRSEVESSAPEVRGEAETGKELNDEDDSIGYKTNSEPGDTGSPVFLESYKSSPFNAEELSAGSDSESEIKPEVSDGGKDVSDFSNPGENLNSYKNEISNSNENEKIGNRHYSKRRRRRKRYARVKRRGGGGAHGKKRKLKHHEKQKKKKKKGKGKKPGEKDGGKKTDSEISRFVDELQVESHMEKRDSGDARSEIDLSKREISRDYRGSENENEFSREKRATQTEGNFSVKDKNDHDEKAQNSHRSGCGNGELRYYDDVLEPEVQKQRVYIETKPERVEFKSRRERTANSVRQIKKLMGKLMDEVDDLDTILDTREGEESKEEKKRARDFWNSSSSVEGDDLKKVSKESKICSDETSSKSKAGKIVEGEEKRSRRTPRRGKKSKKCKIRKRKLHRKWDAWTDWSSCSVTCGKGRQIRWRHCVHDCTNAETEMEEKSCQLPACSPGKFLGIF